jgi:AraC-like DNA-binding protein
MEAAILLVRRPDALASRREDGVRGNNASHRGDVVAEFLSSFPLADTVFDLFDSLADVYFYAKDRQSRFTRVNRNTLTTYDLDDPADLIGHTDKDFHPPALADAYIAEDRRVMETGKPILNQLWLVPHIRGMPRWFVSSKVPLKNSQNHVVGIAGAMYRVEPPADRLDSFQIIQPAIKFMEENLDQSFSMNELAEICSLSSTSFNRHFQKLLRTTPREFLLALRVEAARRMLVTTGTSLAAIATDCGFTDQSHFTKRFQKVTGMTPHHYRERFRT